MIPQRLYSIVVVLAISSFSTSDACIEEDYIYANISDGPIMGITIISEYTGENIYCFRGIPYAAAPIDDLRWKAPCPPPSWTEIKNCTEDQHSCYQAPGAYGVQTMSEDCLYLNVYTPEINPEHLLPVVVLFHGGRFQGGSGNKESYGPDYLVQQGVVVVTINYRLGPLGFLSLGTDELPGNDGLKDQNFALRWVQENIHFFGGDHDQVTLVGHGAGSACAHFHSLSPRSRGLFHRVIGESGTSLAEWALWRNDVPNGLLLAEVLNCSYTDKSEVEECLRTKTAAEIITGASLIIPDNQYAGGLIFVPCVDKDYSDEPFLPDHPKYLIEHHRGSSVPFLIGVNKNEGLSRITEILVEKENITSNLKEFIPKDVLAQISEAKQEQIVEELKIKYFNNTTDLLGCIEIYTHYLYVFNTIQCAKAIVQNISEAEVYLYEFDFDGSCKSEYLSTIEESTNITGVAHNEELNYLWVRQGVSQTVEEYSSEWTVRKRMVKMWTNFVKQGNPTPEEDEDLDRIIWLPVTYNTTYHLKIEKNLTMEYKDLSPEVSVIWDEIYTTKETTPICPSK